jgi:hypothetical protein
MPRIAIIGQQETPMANVICIKIISRICDELLVTNANADP